MKTTKEYAELARPMLESLWQRLHRDNPYQVRETTSRITAVFLSESIALAIGRLTEENLDDVVSMLCEASKIAWKYTIPCNGMEKAHQLRIRTLGIETQILVSNLAAIIHRNNILSRRKGFSHEEREYKAGKDSNSCNPEK